LKAGEKMIKRERYLNQLIKKQWNGRIKIITGIRRCGKSTLLFDLFKAYLMNEGVNEEHVIAIALDDDQNDRFRSPDILSEHVRTLCADKEKKYYLFLDEIQYAISKAELKDKENPPRLYSVLNGLLHLKNVDVYVTGSNSKLLSKDVMTEFRGRGDVIHIYPLSFSEFYEASGLDKADAYNEYMTYGGMPYLLRLESENEKFQYLNELFEEIYFKDIEERYSIGLPQVLRELTTSLCSSVGSLTNASKIARAVNSHKTEKTNSETISSYLTYLTDSFLFSKAERYDVKGKRYFEYPSKYYCTDVGLRNIRLGLRQQEETHIMENLLYNELRVRGYQVDVGVVNVTESNSDGKREQKGLEIDFIARKGSQMVYIQSALRMDDSQKQDSELRSLKAVSDSFQKMVVSKSYGKRWTDENGILRIGLIDFLLDENCLQG
jgi:predicted AAA+ superfamily ATPase